MSFETFQNVIFTGQTDFSQQQPRTSSFFHGGGGVKKGFRTEITDHSDLKGVSVRETARVRVRAQTFPLALTGLLALGTGLKPLRRLSPQGAPS